MSGLLSPSRWFCSCARETTNMALLTRVPCDCTMIVLITSVLGARTGLKQIDARQYTVWDLYQAAEESKVCSRPLN